MEFYNFQKPFWEILFGPGGFAKEPSVCHAVVLATPEHFWSFCTRSGMNKVGCTGYRHHGPICKAETDD